MKNKPKKINLYYTRDFTLSTCDFWHEMLMNNVKQDLGKGIKRQIMRFNGRAVEVYREESEMQTFKNMVLTKNLNNKIFSEKAKKTFKINIDKTMRLMAGLKGTSLDELINQFNESVRMFSLIYPWVMFSVFLPKWEDEFVQRHGREGKKIISRWYEARVFSEGKFEMIDAYWRELAAKLLKRDHLDEKYCRLISFEELKQLISGGKVLTEKILKERQKGYILYKGALMPGKDFAEFLCDNNLYYDDPEKKSTEAKIHGQMASKGVTIRGTVQTIMNIDEVSEFRKGNILVTTMTVPDFVPAMKKAAAIVTERGGVTSHAAIVSREMRIPCVIGTKIATKVLKDGDLVEVDADKGIVKILKK